MNTYTLSPTTTTTSVTATEPIIDLFDITEVTLDLSNIYTEVFPYYIGIAWGDDSQVFEPDLKTFLDYRTESIIDQITKGVLPPFLIRPYKHVYKPSSSSLVKKLTLQIGIQYITGDITQINVPVNIRTEGYYQNIGDLSIEGATIVNNTNFDTTLNLRTSIDNYIVETTNNSNNDKFTSFVINDVGENLKDIEAQNNSVIVKEIDGTEIIIVE